MPPKPLEPGDPLRLGRFELLGRLGEGGQGIVYLGRGTNPGEDRVAVKVLRSTVDATVLERLARELDAIHQVQPFVTAGVIEASAEGDRRPIVRECLAKDPTRRPSARDLLLRLVDPSAQRTPAARTGPAAPVDSVPLTGPLPHHGSRSHTGSLAPLAEPTISGPEPPRFPGPGAAPARSWRRPILAACGAAAVAALVVVGVLLLTRGSPPGTPATVSSSLAGRASSPATAAAQRTQTTQTTGVTIPAAFAGTWKGTATMSAIGVSAVSLKNSIAFTFVAGGRTAQENNQDCVNTLTLTGATATALTFSEPQTAQCVAGMVTFTRQGANLAYHWTDNIEQNVATLRKS